MTKQEAFDKVWEHFVVNKGPKSYIPREEACAKGVSMCLYRGPNGAKCAFGLLLPDDLYHPGMEGDRAATIIKRHQSVAKFLGVEPAHHNNNLNDMERFFNELQSAHDNADPDTPTHKYFTDSITQRLRLVADRHHLTVPATT